MFLYALKIITLLPSLTEAVLYFSSTALIGVSRFDKLDLPKFTGYEYEKILRLNPDEVWLDSSQEDLIMNYRKLKINFRVFNTTRLRTVSELYEEIMEISELVGEKSKGMEIIKKLEASFFDAGKKRKALWLISIEPVVLYGRDSVFADILEKFGFDVSLFPPGLSRILPFEKFLSMDFDVLFIPQSEYRKLKFFKKKCYILESEISARANHKLIFYLKDVFKN